ncbi:hypothetical protein QL285_046847 [Trifolium repens]|nr:hypothetical protein QL285_046847 [Trifolium repens]
MIEIHHPPTIQIGESTLSSEIMTLVLLYEPLPDMDESFSQRLVFYNRYLIWIKYHVKELYYLQLAKSHCNRDELKFLCITIERFETSCYSVKNHLKHKNNLNTT